MAIRAFPPVELADEYGLLAVGGDLEIPSLLLAYESGIFPWPLPGEERMTWFAPPQRAVLFVDEFHVSRSLKKELKRRACEFYFDRDFRRVIRECSSLVHRPGQSGTWITDAIVDAYTELHRAGYAHSLECYENGELVGGLYGVTIGRMFTGESMFYRSPNASKFALYLLASYLQECGGELIDCQVLNPHLEKLGVREIPREDFMEHLARLSSQDPLPFSNARLQQVVTRLTSRE